MSVEEALVGDVVATEVLEELMCYVHDLTHSVVILQKRGVELQVQTYK